MGIGELAPATFKALLVGNADFPADPFGLAALKGPLNDVDALHKELSRADTGLFRCQRPLKNAPAATMVETIGEFFAAADRDDCLLFYYSGHGRIDLDGDFYLCAHDSDTAKPHAPKVSGVELAKIVHHSPAALKIIILDCCYASEFKGGMWSPRYFRGQGRFVLAAARRGGPLVPDARTPQDLSPFTAALIEALRRADLDADGDGYITVDDVARYISDQAADVPNAPYALQQWTGTGIVPIARSTPEAPQPPPPPPSPPPPVGALPDLLPVPSEGAPEFYLSRHLVTNGQFRAFLRDPANEQWRPRTARRSGRHVDQDYLRDWDEVDVDPEFEHYPVVTVSLDAAKAYTAWAGEQLGRPLRVPRRSEWERAAAAGRNGNWPAQDVAVGRVNFRGTLAALSEVGEFRANPYDLCDLLGNVWEICVDDAGSPSLHGGAFDTPRERLLERLVPASPVQCRADVGFRCAC